jgi:hypothetical protein
MNQHHVQSLEALRGNQTGAAASKALHAKRQMIFTLCKEISEMAGGSPLGFLYLENGQGVRLAEHQSTALWLAVEHVLPNSPGACKCWDGYKYQCGCGCACISESYTHADSWISMSPCLRYTLALMCEHALSACTQVLRAPNNPHVS